MPNQDKQNDIQDPYMKGAMKAAEKRGAEEFNQAADTIGSEDANKQLLGKLVEMRDVLMQATQPFEVEGTKQGLGMAIGEAVAGRGFDPNAPRQAQLSPNLALQMMEMTAKQETRPFEKQKLLLEIDKLKQSIEQDKPETRRALIKDEVRAKKEAEMEAKIQQSMITAEHNLFNTMEAAHDLSEWLVKGYIEGGAGNAVRAWFTGMATKGLLGQEMGGQLADSATIPGKREEMLLKMFPMLTQQIGKEGSVRLIESVLDRIGVTIPNLETPPKIAVNQLQATIQSMYRVARAIDSIDLDFTQMTDKNMDRFVNLIARQVQRIEIKGKEKEVLEDALKTSTKPLVTYLEGLETGKGSVAVKSFEPGKKKSTMSAEDMRFQEYQQYLQKSGGK